MPFVTVNIPLRPLFRLLYIALAVLFLLSVGFGIFYLVTGYEGLVHWFFSLNNGCFYNNDRFISKFYTVPIWSDGRMYSSIAISVSLFGLYYLSRKFRKANTLSILSLRINSIDIILSMVAMIIAFCLWWKGNKDALPAYDEIFSANNIAS